MSVAELSTTWFNFSWIAYLVPRLWLDFVLCDLNCLLGGLTLAELLLGDLWLDCVTGRLDPSWTVYLLTWLWRKCLLGDLKTVIWLKLNCLGDLNCLLIDFTLVKLSTESLDSGWIFYWVTWFHLNSLLGDLTSWSVYRLTWLWLNCLLSDSTLTWLFTDWPDSAWAVF